MSLFIDLAGSWIVRASMIAVMLGLTVSMNNALYQSAQQANADTYVTVVDSILYADINDAGYNVSDPTTTFETASSSNLQFLADINGGGVPETIHYYTGQQISGTDTTYILYRTVNNVNNGNPLTVATGLKSVTFSYYDNKGVSTSILSSIRQVRVTVVGVLTDVIDGSSTVTGDFKIYPANLL